MSLLADIARVELVDEIAQTMTLPELDDLGALLRDDPGPGHCMLGPREQAWANDWAQRRLLEKGLTGFWDRDLRSTVGPTLLGQEVLLRCRERWRERAERERRATAVARDRP